MMFELPALLFDFYQLFQHADDVRGCMWPIDIYAFVCLPTPSKATKLRLEPAYKSRREHVEGIGNLYYCIC